MNNSELLKNNYSDIIHSTVNIFSENYEVIRFDNLLQRSAVVGGKGEAIQAKAKPFVSSNARGVLRTIENRDEAGKLAEELALKVRAAIRG